MKEQNGFLKFLGSKLGQYCMCGLFAAILWGIAMFVLLNYGAEAPLIVMLVFAIFGWRALNKIQPVMFLWMSWPGWVLYFLIKFILSYIVGIFLGPIQIGNALAKLISENINISK